MTFLQNSFYKEEQILEEYEKENNRYVNDIENQLSHFLWIVILRNKFLRNTKKRTTGM